MKKYLIAILLSFSFFMARAAIADDIFRLQDPRGDDVGDGTLIFPTQGDIRAGDLDIVSFSAKQEGDGTMFEVGFSNAIAAPGSRAMDAGGTPLSQIARLGFYTFNIDIYIDTDRKPGSGFTSMLPGRKAFIHEDTAWEKMISVTPRPQDMKPQLQKMLQELAEDKLRAEKGRVDPEDNTRIASDIALDLNGRYFFPTRVRVSTKRIQFFVPGNFLNGPAQAEWSYVVVVTAATIEDRVDLGNFGTSQFDRGLGNLPVAEGGWSDRLGTSRKEADMLPPIVDIIAPKGAKQEDILRDFNVNEKRYVKLPGVVPGQ